MERLSLRERAMLIILLIAGGFCFYYFLLSPQLKAYAQITKELADARAKLSQAQAAVASLRNESTKLDKVKKEMQEIGKPFATEIRDGSDIILLGLKSAAENIQITSLEPGKIQENPHSLEMPLKINVEGDYLNLVFFCNDIESLTNLAEIRKIKIETLGSSTADFVLPGMVKATLEIVIFSAKNPEARLHLEELTRWLTGRYNIFQPAGAIPPLPELRGHLKIPAETPPPGSDASQPPAIPPATPPTTLKEVYGSPEQPGPEYIWRK